MGGCTITFDSTAPEDTASWYDLWAAAVALDGMCARGGKTGKSRFLGEVTRIWLPVYLNAHFAFLGANRKLVVEMKK